MHLGRSVSDAPVSTRMTVEDVERTLSEIARSEGTQRVQALRMLASLHSGAAALPAPLNDQEIQDRAVRLMRAMGSVLVRRCYAKAFSTVKIKVQSAIEPAGFHDLSEEDRAKVMRIRRLKHLYREFPAIKQSGTPKGFPILKSLEVQMEWCRQQAIRILRDREIKRLQAQDAETQALDQPVTEGTDAREET